MNIFRSFAIATLVTSTVAVDRIHNLRKLSFELIAGYEPSTVVTDHNAIAYDQAKIEELLSTPSSENFLLAKDVYELGGFSKSYAEVTLKSALSSKIADGTPISGKAVDGSTVTGTALGTYESGATVIQIQYDTSARQETYVRCTVGGNNDPNIEGCFASNGTLSIEGYGDGQQYTYTPTKGNKNERTIRGFSKAADTKMRGAAGAPFFPDFQKFVDYYGAITYADDWLQACFTMGSTSFKNGNANFAEYGDDGRVEIIKKGTVFMNIAMYVIRELEDALVDCENGCAKGECNADPVSALDEAVAFYTGALEGTDGSGNGNLMHALADKRCVNFKTCGREGNADSGTSRVNYEIFKLFDRMQDELSGTTADKCATARITKEKIVPLMFVPLIQGTLRYAYITENEGYSEKSEAEGAAFAAAVLPMVAACNMDDANIIYSNMRVGQKNSATYADVSAAFERQYDCLGITCADVGGVWNSANAMYEDGAGPCGTSSSSNSTNVGLAVGLTFLGLALVVLLVVVVRRRGSSSRRTISARKGEQQDQVEAQEAPVI